MGKLFEDLFRVGKEESRLYQMIDERMGEIFGVANVFDGSFDYNPWEEEVSISTKIIFTPTAEQLDLVWKLGAKRLHIYFFDLDGEAQCWYFYAGGPVEGKRES